MSYHTAKLSLEAQAARDRKLILDLRRRKYRRRKQIKHEVDVEARKENQMELVLHELKMRSKREHARKLAEGSSKRLRSMPK